jgi:hypothetical protein
MITCCFCWVNKKSIAPDFFSSAEQLPITAVQAILVGH